MADNNTFVLFEEIKNKLETIYRELKELKEKENNSFSLPIQSTPVQRDEQMEQELLNQYEQRTKAIAKLLDKIKKDLLQNGKLEELFVEVPYNENEVVLKLSFPVY